MSNEIQLNKTGAQQFICFECTREHSARRGALSTAFLVASTFLAMGTLPMSGAQASAGATLGDARPTSLSQTFLNWRAVDGNYTVLAIIEKPKRDRTPPDGGDGDKPKRPEKRAVVSVHG